MRNRKIMQMTRFAAVRGVTLIELTVVLLVLVALAGLTLPMYTNTPRYAQCVATDATMANIRDAIMGSGGMGGYRSDMGGVPRLDNNITQASANASSLNDLYNNPFYDYLIPGYTAAGYTGYSNPPFNPSFNPPATPNSQTPSYNPTTQRGWRGPYMSGGMTCAALAALLNKIIPVNSTDPYRIPNIDSQQVCELSTSTSLSPPYTSTLPNTVALDSFPVIATDTTGDTMLTLQGSPIVLMNDNIVSGIPKGNYFLVSGGPTGGIQITPSNTAVRYDDRVLYLNSVDPGSNQPCS